MSYTPPTQSTKLSIGASYGGVNAIAEEALEGFKQTESVGGTVFSGYFSDQPIKPIAPFFYQAYAEIGYYGYEITDFKDLLTEIKEHTSKIFLLKGTDPEFNYPLMQKINTWVQKELNNMIFIYGEIDTWSAPAVQLTGETNAAKMVKEGGPHRTRIKDFSKRRRRKLFMMRWKSGWRFESFRIK